MSPGSRDGSSARLRAIEMISGLLASIDLRDLGRKLTEELRELSGAGTALLYVHRGGAGTHELVHACPEHRSGLFSPREVALFCMETVPDPLPSRTADIPPDEPLRSVLSGAGVASLLRFPLRAGGELVGILLLLDLPGPDRVPEADDIIALLSPPIALALRNTVALEQIEKQRQEIRGYARELERRVEERTAELAAANTDLLASRLAALNIMEDAVEARDRAEQANDALRREMEERKRAEEALRESEERFRTLVEQAGVGFELLDPDGRYVDANSATCRQLGYSKEELLSLNVVDVSPKTPRDLYAATFQSLVDCPPVTFETTNRRKDGTEFPVEITTSVIRLGGALRALSLVRDITERKRTEEEQDHLRAQLAQAQKIESVGRLAGGVAHDFNNMLTVILGHTEMGLVHASPAQPVHANLVAIQKAAKRSADLTRQLLGFARKQTVAPRVLDLNETVAGMLKMLQRLIGEDIDLAWFPGPGLWPVKIDPSQVDQLLANLCVNARDAIAGQGKVTIETANVTFDEHYCADRADVLPGAYVMLAVSDDGCGMERNVIEHLFEPFFTTKEVGRGTGLGLATVYGIVKQNGGFINVYSEPGKGSTFNIYLGRCAGETSDRTAASAKEPPRSRGETVLLVEDEKTVLEMGCAMLRQLGYTVLAAGSPAEAIRLAQAHDGTIHLLITDVVMPEMNGRALRERIAAVKPGFRCLFISGYTADVIANRGVLEAGVHFLQKPFSLEGLAARVRAALERA